MAVRIISKPRVGAVCLCAAGALILLSILNYALQHQRSLMKAGPLPGITGTIEIGALESNSSTSSTLYIYEVNSADGAITLASSQKLNPTSSLGFENLPNGAHISTCADQASSSIISPDGRYTAVCTQQFVGSGQIDSIKIIDSLDGSTIKTLVIENFMHVRGMAWSPDSSALAVLKGSQRLGFGPTELLSALSGHPVAYSDIGFVAVRVDRNEGQGLPFVGQEFRSAWCFIKWRQ